MPSRIVLLSGGLDSAVALLQSIAEGWATHALTVDYGQMCQLEIEKASALARQFGAATHSHISVKLPRIDTALLGGSMPSSTLEEMRAAEISSAFMPGRNSLLISTAFTISDHRGAAEIWIGCNLDDLKFPDCSAAFIEAMTEVSRLSTEGNPRVCAPLISHTKPEIAALSVELGITGRELTVSCYKPHRSPPHHCGCCDACIIRYNAFTTAGLRDSVGYRV